MEKSVNIEIYQNHCAFPESYERQKFHHNRVASEGKEDQIMLLEHSPVYTMGKQDSHTDFLVSTQNLRGSHVAKIDRGGKVTFHGPGQIVAYFICNLGKQARNIRRFVFCLEEIIIVYLLDRFEIVGQRRAGLPGIWIDENVQSENNLQVGSTFSESSFGKIAALGISIHKSTTMHGFSLNINTDLSYFDAIIPCGNPKGRTVSVQSVLDSQSKGKAEGDNYTFDLVLEKKLLAKVAASVLGYRSLTCTYV